VKMDIDKKETEMSSEEIDNEIARLMELKANISNGKKKKHFSLKTPKGTRDYHPSQMRVREKVLNDIIAVFDKHGATMIDTPVFELKETLTGRYGEDSKLIYDLKDQGGEILALRYDLTVPFARYIAMNKISTIKRYHIAKVYRRDNPATTRGRYREFVQCDFDIAGDYDSLIPDVECLIIVYDILKKLDIGDYRIKVNHRKLLTGLFECCGVPEDKFKTICSAVDKLDKLPWEKVRQEMTEEKGLDESAADLIGNYVKLTGYKELVEQLKSDPVLSQNKNVQVALEEMETCLKYCDLYGIQDKVVFDMSLARGLDYYTGLIFEAFLIGSTSFEDGVGSLAGGGRYDGLVGMFHPKNATIPCVGVSMGVERIFTIMEKRMNETVQCNKTEVYVAAAQKNMLDHRLGLCRELWDAGICTETSYKKNPKFLNQMNYCEENKVKIAVLIGESELENNIVKLKNISTRTEREVPRSSFIEEIQNELLGS